MNFFRPIYRLLVLLMALAVVSCIDGREEIWLNADGSGRAEVTYSLPASAARFQGGEAGIRKLLDDFLKNTPAITSFSHEVTTRDGRLTVRVRTWFESAQEMGEISKDGSLEKLPPSATGLTGTTEVKLLGRTVDFARTIDAGRALPGSSLLPASQFEGRSLKYIIHLPLATVESNATRVEDEGRTLVWEIPLAQAVRGPLTTRFKAPFPIPRWILFTAAGGALAGALVMFRLIRKRKDRRTV